MLYPFFHPLMWNYTKSIDVYDPNLIFKGLKVIYEKNKD